MPVRLSRYSYLVSLFPAALVDRLGIRLDLRSRQVSSFTPVERGRRSGGLLVERVPGPATEDSFRALTGSGTEFAVWQRWYGQWTTLAGVLAPLLSGPLARAADVARLAAGAGCADLWEQITHRPLGSLICERFADDTVRGVVATDGLIGTHTSLLSADLSANRCFLYHLIGRGTGEWLVPVGGMGTVADALVAAATAAGVRVVTGAPVEAVGETAAEVVAVVADGREFVADHLLAAAAVAPATVRGWLGQAVSPPVGAQLKINMVLDRLPRLAGGADPEQVFAGTTHLAEGFDELEQAYRISAEGRIPEMIPSEVYCHSLTDPSIMAGRPGATLTLFGLHTPDALFRADPDQGRELAARGALRALEQHLAEPLDDCLARDSQGRPCVDVADPVDLERSLGMPGGNIFHGPLDWPWLPDGAEVDSPAEAYGVRVPGTRGILLAGAGPRRGGGGSGRGGEAAVDALLAADGRRAS